MSPLRKVLVYTIMAAGGLVAAGSAWELFFRNSKQRAEDALFLLDQWNRFRYALLGKDYQLEEAIAFLNEDLAPQVARERGRLQQDRSVAVDRPPGSLGEGDLWLKKALPELFAEGAPLAGTHDLLSYCAVVIERAAEGRLPERLLWHPQEPLLVVEREGRLFLDPASYHRYDALTHRLLEIDVDRLFQLYRLLRPILEEQFGPDFEQKLLRAIDLALKTPEVHGEIELLPLPGGRYRFADPKLEALPPIQKLLIRMGVENSRIVKAQLARLRAKLVSHFK